MFIVSFHADSNSLGHATYNLLSYTKRGLQIVYFSIMSKKGQHQYRYVPIFYKKDTCESGKLAFCGSASERGYD